MELLLEVANSRIDQTSSDLLEVFCFCGRRLDAADGCQRKSKIHPLEQSHGPEASVQNQFLVDFVAHPEASE